MTGKKIPSTIDELILVPHHFLHLFPLHTLPLNNGLGLFELERFSLGVRYGPSCQILEITQNQVNPNFNQLLAISNPTQDLQYIELAVEIISQYFNPKQVLPRNQATKTQLTSIRTYLNSSHCFFFGGHGTFNSSSPLTSGLVLANQELLYLWEIFGLDLSQCRLVILSACETFITDINNLSDEYIGLPSAFLYAGTASLVGSLWTVPEISTTVLMIKLIELLKDSEQRPTLAVALREAQIWLRDITIDQLEDWINNLSLNSNQEQKLFDWLDYLEKTGNTKPCFSPYDWAAFCAIGQ